MKLMRSSIGLLTAILCSGLLGVSPLSAQPVIQTVQLARDMMIGETLHGPGFEREAITTLTDVSPRGIRFIWAFVEVHSNGDTIKRERPSFVSAGDLDTAARMHMIQSSDTAAGYTRMWIARKVFDEVRSKGSVAYSVLSQADPLDSRNALLAITTGQVRSRETLAQLGLNSGRKIPVRYRGTFRLANPTPEPFPLLVNGQRVRVPALRLRSAFTAPGRKWNGDWLVLADRNNPLVLHFAEGGNVLRVVRIDHPVAAAAAVERALTSACRAEVPGIYFATNSAVLDPASDKIIGNLAGIMSRHREWRLTIEGHTDSVGTDADNKLLSERRAAAVRDRLVSRHRISSARLGSAGFGESKPRETNATIEGRARNRRVEILRPC